MINVTLDIQQLKQDYEQFNFNKGKRIKLLPFDLQLSKINKNALKYDLSKFDAIIGELFRVILSKEKDGIYDDGYSSEKDRTIGDILKEINIKNENINDFKDILKRIIFDENGDYFLFSKELFLYMNFKSTKIKPLKRISYFIYNFFNEELIKKISEKFEVKKSDNLLYQLVMDSFSELKVRTKTNTDINYYLVNKDIIRLFQKDFMILLNSTEEFFVSNISILLKYYYFHYIKELILCLDSFFERKTPKIFLSLDWETLSKNRYAYDNGWKKLELKVNRLFTHINTLDFLNYLDFKGKDKVTYKLILNNYIDLDPEQIIGYIEEIIDFIKTKEHHNYNLFLLNLENNSRYTEENNSLFKKIYELWFFIEFIISKKGGVDKKYPSGFTEFIKYNFLKKRGQLGLSLSIDKETLLFFTKIIINNNEKIKIKQLWIEFEKRGLLFDRESKKIIIELFERLNILEKKSDSGDAQYVKINK